VRHRHHYHRQLARDPVLAKMGGVCAGIARYLGVPVLTTRLVAIIGLCIAPMVTLLAYGLAYLILEAQS
jgi:phage shock protein C